MTISEAKERGYEPSLCGTFAKTLQGQSGPVHVRVFEGSFSVFAEAFEEGRRFAEEVGKDLNFPGVFNGKDKPGAVGRV